MTHELAAGIVIGAGVAGLAFARAMRGRGLPVAVLESAATLRATGSGLVLGPTALLALRKLALADEVLASGQILDSGGLTDLALRPLSQDAFGYFSGRTGECFVGIERGTLIRLLAEPVEDCHLGVRYQCLTERRDGVLVTLDTGAELRAPWVVLADGIRSVGRASLATAVIRDAGQWCWRGIARDVDLGRFARAFTEAWGSEWRFGFTPVGAGRSYWFLTQRDKLGLIQPTAPGRDRFGYVLAAASRLSPLLDQLVRSTPAADILETRLEDLSPLSRWHSARVVCIGDAAHAMTPNLGQGATQALEDAVILAGMMADIRDELGAVFAAFEAMRRPRTERTVRAARLLGQIAHLPTLVTGLRDAALRSIPHALSLKQLAWLYEDARLTRALS